MAIFELEQITQTSAIETPAQKTPESLIDYALLLTAAQVELVAQRCRTFKRLDISGQSLFVSTLASLLQEAKETHVGRLRSLTSKDVLETLPNVSERIHYSINGHEIYANNGGERPELKDLRTLLRDEHGIEPASAAASTRAVVKGVLAMWSYGTEDCSAIEGYRRAARNISALAALKGRASDTHQRSGGSSIHYKSEGGSLVKDPQ